jgi:putative nucleotidyltransferase with HDIG domain
MKRILFVDDEPQVLDILRRTLQGRRHEWDMSFATSAHAALEEVARSRVDVVVSDMRMPGMDGAALLGKVKAISPGTVRIILSGAAEREPVMRSLPVSHQYLNKLCGTETLCRVIDRACQLQALLVDPKMRDMVGKLDRIPSIPDTYWKLTLAVSDPDVDMDEIASIIERDPSLSSKVLQLANSAYFGLAQRVASVGRAVVNLGLDVIRSLALTTEVFSAAERAAPVPGFSIQELFDQSLAVANIARQIVRNPKLDDEAYTAGILIDIGKLILAMGEPERFGQALKLASQSKRPSHIVEKEILGVSHAEIGAFLLGSWGLPIETVAAVAYHHSPLEATDVSDLILAVHVADALAEEAVAPLDNRSGAVSPLDRHTLETLGLSSTRLDEWRATAKQTLKSKRLVNAI